MAGCQYRSTARQARRRARAAHRELEHIDGLVPDADLLLGQGASHDDVAQQVDCASNRSAAVSVRPFRQVNPTVVAGAGASSGRGARGALSQRYFSSGDIWIVAFVIDLLVLGVASIAGHGFNGNAAGFLRQTPTRLLGLDLISYS